MLTILILYVLPAFFIVRDTRAKPVERAIWLLATLLVSWVAFILFLLIAPLSPADSENETDLSGDEENSEETSPERGAMLAGKVGLAVLLLGAGGSLIGLGVLAYLFSAQTDFLVWTMIFGAILLGTVVATFSAGRTGLVVGLVALLALSAVSAMLFL